MSYKIVHISKPCKIKVYNHNLIIVAKDESFLKVGIKDLDFLLIDSRMFSITGHALELISRYKIATLFVDEYSHPSSILLPYHQYSLFGEMAYIQIGITYQFKAECWKYIIESKVYNQSSVLQYFESPKYQILLDISKSIELNDKTKGEALSARIYWKALFGRDFLRDQKSKDIINSMLNYAYSLIRACMARSISVVGFLPVFGICHHSKYNAFNLVDDLIEPFRALVDLYIVKLINSKKPNILDTDLKHDILQMLSVEIVNINQGQSTFIKAIEIFVQSYKQAVLQNSISKLKIPTINFNFDNYEYF